MKKVYLLGALAGLMMASCANDEVVNPVTPADKAKAPMAFNMGVKNMGRDDTPFQTVMDNFGVYAAKVNGADAAALDAAFKGLTWDDATNGLDPQVIMNNYKVEWQNPDWVYDGVTGDAPQFLKYWDGSYAKTYFVAYAPFGKTTAPVAVFNNTVPSLFFPGVKISTDKNDNFMYSNVQIEDNAAHVATEATVPLKFNSLLSQVKLAIYEAIPGYSVEMAELVFDGSADPHGIVAIPADYDATATPAWSRGSYVSKGEATVTYQGVSFADDPDVTYDNTDTDDADLEFDLPEGEIATTYAGATPIPTTYYVLPNANGNSGLQFVMNYTLKSDDTNEVINVKGARVYVQPEYTAWAPNTVYTYVFRITTASSGTTEDKDPEDKPEEPGKALYPIVFAHLTVAQMDNNGEINEWDVNPETDVTNPHDPAIHN